MNPEDTASDGTTCCAHLVAVRSWEARRSVDKERLEVAQAFKRLETLWGMLSVSALPVSGHRLTGLTSFRD